MTAAHQLLMLNKHIDAIKEGLGQDKPMMLNADLSYDATYDALQGACEQWRHTLMASELIGYLKTLKQLEAVSTRIGKRLSSIR